MTDRGPLPGRSPWPASAWAMVGLTLVALSVGILGSVLSPSIVLDAVAIWPFAALAVPAFLLGLRGGRSRALAPLVLISWMLITVGLHLGGVDGLPSGAATLRPDIGAVSTARLSVAVPDLGLRIGSGDFEIRPAPVGGRAGAPVVEQVTGSAAAAVTVTDDREASPWFRYGEYEIDLPSSSAWDLRIAVASVDLDLSGVTVSGARIEAATGRIVLGTPTQAATIRLTGAIEVSVPPDVPVRVTGTTSVPDDWQTDGDDAVSGIEGDGWTIIAESGSVRIVSR